MSRTLSLAFIIMVTITGIFWAPVLSAQNLYIATPYSNCILSQHNMPTDVPLQRYPSAYDANGSWLSSFRCRLPVDGLI